MRPIRRNILFLSCLLCFTNTAFSQSSQRLQASSLREATLTVSRGDTAGYLPHQLSVPNSEIFLLDSTLLVSGSDYSLDNRFGIIRFLPALITRLRSDTTAQHALHARYQIFPFNLKEHYQHRELIVRQDTLDQVTKVARPVTTFPVDDLFGANLQKNGSLVRGFTIGSNRDLSLTSGFRMQVAGKIASDIEVVAALTDENTPIQPEGNTQTLSEIDKVFVEIRSTDVSATLGDFNLDFTGNEFGGYHRKLQGAKGVANYRTGFANGGAIISGAVNRGKFNTNEFLGIEGVQGPYRLSGRNGERAIIIIAGTEKVYVDGEPMTRGETNDYIIDYASGEVTFTSRRLITGISRIVVDFEYTDRQYTRNLLGAKGGVNILDDKIRLNITMIREADDQNAPIDLLLNESDKEILRNAGGDRLKASRSGVDSVGAGNGQYVAVDTTINGVDTLFYRFAPGDSTAAYNVFFSFVSAGRGDYNRVSIGNFIFVGFGQGGYLPIRFLPLPQVQTLTDFDINALLTDNLTISGEYAISTMDANRFSTLDDVNTGGAAFNFGVQFKPESVRVGATNIGSFDLRFRERFVNRRFSPIDRLNDVEFNRRWNLEQTGAADEDLREGSLHYQPIDQLTVGGGLGRVRRGDEFTSSRSEANLRLSGEKMPNVAYNIEAITSRDTLVDSRGNWLRQRGVAEFAIGAFTPGFRYENEDQELHSVRGDSLRFGSFRFHEFAPRLLIADVWNISLTSEFAWRLGDSLLAPNGLQRESQTFTQQYSWKLKEWNTLSSSIDVTLRKKKLSEAFRLRGNSDVETVLLRFQSRYAPLNRGFETDLFYEVATQRASKLERVFVRVERGRGTYRYLGDMNNNGIVDDGDFEIDRFGNGEYILMTIPSDELFPIVDLKASTRFRITPSRFLEDDGGVNRIISAFSSETYLRVEEKSRETDTRQIYFLRFSRFLNDITTIIGNNFISQDLYVFESSPELSFRFRYTQRRGFTQFALANERSYARERSVRIRWQLVKEFSNQTDYVNKVDNVFSSERSIRARNIASNSILSDWSYRPEQNVELGFTFGVGSAEDTDSLPATTADFNSLAVRLVYSFQERGQGRIELQREEVMLNRSRAFLPFEMTGGRLPGKTWLWRVGFEYRLTQYIQSGFSYDGRSEGGRTPIHTARAEVRAFF
jgi:hypothetical protein